MIKKEQFEKRANKIYTSKDCNYRILRKAYVRGCTDTMNLIATESPDFYEELAADLRSMWPAGEKDGKWSWRSSVQEIASRLKFIWKERELVGKYTIDDCLVAARKYLSQFEDNAKYMQILKYFIFKQKGLVDSTGKTTYTYTSTFVDLLENGQSVNVTEDWAGILNESSLIEQGELI